MNVFRFYFIKLPNCHFKISCFFQLACAGLVRILVLLNPCVNPVVYATTIPAFKALIKRFFSCDKLNAKSTRKPNDRKDAKTKSKEEEEVSLGSNT